MFNKSSITTFISLFFILISFFIPLYSKYFFNIGLFAFSGSITNWIAVHMLFEKVPLLYGSGVIQIKFKEFKEGIKNLVMNQFFNSEMVEKHSLMNDFQLSDSDIERIVSSIDTDAWFDELLLIVQESPLGGMLAMFGGTEALNPMRGPFKQKISQKLKTQLQEENFQKQLLETFSSSSQENSDLSSIISKMVDKRLEELTPIMVKDILKTMIHDHLGWLVVWGGIFGGLIGFFSTLLENFIL